MTYPFAFDLPSSRDDLCETSMKFRGKQDDCTDLPTANSSGGLAGDGVRLFFRLPIMRC